MDAPSRVCVDVLLLSSGQLRRHNFEGRIFMTGSLTYSSPGPSRGPEEEPRSLGQLVRDLFRKNPLANGIFFTAIIIGFFHGWLKIRYRSALTTFAFDIPVVLAMAIVVLTPRKEALFPSGSVGNALKFHTLICILYIPLSILIWGVQPLAVLAAFRGWCVIPLIFLLGYHLTTGIRHVEIYMWLMIVLGFVTAVYGIFQSEEQVRQMMILDPELEYRFQNQFYANKGVSQFRRFSTFVSSAAFAAQLAYSTSFAFSRLTVKSCGLIEKIILGVMVVVMSYALILTGARSGLLQLVIAVLFTAWYRRGGVQFFLVPILFVVAWKLGSSATSGSSIDRYSTLLESQTIWWRLWIVVGPSWDAFIESPLGTGLGSSSHGVPMFLVSRLRNFRSIDGDLGHVIVDMGFLGLFSICNLFACCVVSAWRWMTRLRDTPMSVISLPSGIFLYLSVSTFPIGTPFLGIPYGSVLWFFFGALSRLCFDYENAVATGNTSTASFREKFTSFIAKPKLQKLFQESEGGDPSSMVKSPEKSAYVPYSRSEVKYGYRATPRVRTIGPDSARRNGEGKRFLFPKPPKSQG